MKAPAAPLSISDTESLSTISFGFGASSAHFFPEDHSPALTFSHWRSCADLALYIN